VESYQEGAGMMIKVGDWIRFYTNSTTPNTTEIGEVKSILADGSFAVENAVMKYFVKPSEVKRVLHIQQAAGEKGFRISDNED
jgi:hypothetical protein